MRIIDHDGIVVQHLDEVGPVIATSADTSDLIGNAWAAQADLVAVPVSRLDPEFFRLRSGMAGEILQKAVNYHLQIAVVGDISEHLAASEALRAFVAESNRGQHAWFVPDEAALEAQIARIRRV
ncbi:DUF4180 domain-containing protein [Cellulomonas chengniuliangii]|uniref:DUF4180 domain-containing protein n=1 Tax=Cellulomonas chengniuliangii TaxID=2968084 RepID=A0ABY5KXE9_9CELL|nr:DUF4180 domain-containing protein [Cellulomonas chengniuliangii]MCC2309269.1 DUF4180 domain-containing protein [Cellulomonas chengniuliangii]MCC2318613.1 DUF4180 domain-containing protein [Cellulomonas chengniuliangii]UUI75162.1 DUF4180 domain-containing protein [Cellulomonas chengniuliangii]